ncbi:MAG TPA: dihydroorotate dehydrogenase-like protein [Actinomycetota bacterium]
MIDLTTRYLGLDLRSPLVASPGPVTEDFGMLLRLEEAGAGAVVLPSLFEEQIANEALDMHTLLASFADSTWEADSFAPDMDDYNMGPRAYLEYLEAAAQTLSIPVIASLNGASTGGWIEYARRMEEAGAAAIELNVYYVAADPKTTSADVESRYLDLVAAVRGSVSLPIAVKVGPYFSALANMAMRLVEAGADGLVLFNRFLQPDIDLESLRVVPTLQLSSPAELRAPLRWVALLRGVVGASLAASTGVHTAEDAVKLILAGADVVMMTSALIRHGPEYVSIVQDGVVTWLEAGGYASVGEARGSLSREAVPDPAAFERANYMQAIVSYSTAFHR